MSYQSGFVSIIGRPNVGKSTMMNQLVGEKIAIVSDKPQTTRNRIQSVYTEENLQIVFLDTPGIHKPKTELGEYMVKTAKASLRDMDVILFMVDESDRLGGGDQYILEELKKIKTPKILLINKIDKTDQDSVKDIVKQYEDMELFESIIPISALEGVNLQRVIEEIKEYLPEGPQYFPEGMITDQPERAIIAELVREKVLHYTEQEIPHGVAVEVVSMKERPNKAILDLEMNIYCERNSHKGIIIGKNGRKLKGIGKSAREDIEGFLGTKVNLQLWVKVKEGWRNQNTMLRNFGYRDDS
ncbi:GTPase Era [Isachenkonia alkalipeptolytica]|uniref:GTPase Era n=1 Tax=Isachenkonia alkalipeptolytica TaxID=2565777 RepID=A0AA43XN90_9CLOT|nr:GTPase Era [Isachenkonia alkalipeptolytica]NBG89319.1 GTPase Era [Isachenkonia alkalipeptolytica]